MRLYGHGWAYSIGGLRRPHSSNIFSSETAGPMISKPNFIWSLHEMGEREYIRGLGHMTKMAATPIYGKNPLKIFFSRPKGPMSLGLGMQNWGLVPNKFIQMMALGWPWPFFRTRSNLLSYAFIWENIHFFRKNVGKSFNGRNLQQMTRVTKGLCWYKNFDPKGLSSPALGLDTCRIFWNLQQMGKVIFLKLVTNDQSEKMFLLTSKFCTLGVVCPCPGAIYIC